MMRVNYPLVYLLTMSMLMLTPALSLSLSMSIGGSSSQVDLRTLQMHTSGSGSTCNPKRIAIIGQGIMGLTCAARLLEEIATGGGTTPLPSISTIDVYSKEKFDDTTSMSAGGYWWPHKAYPQRRVETWSKETYQIYKELAKIPYETGIHLEQHVRICVDQDDSSYVLNLLDDPYEVIQNGKVEEEYGISNCYEAYKLRVPVIDIPIFMPWLKHYVESLASSASDTVCNLITQEVTSLHDLFQPNYKEGTKETMQPYDLVINCCGVYAKQLVNDHEVYPIRGQVVRLSSESFLPQGDDDSALSSTRLYQKDDSFTLVLPRLHDVVLGGTSQINDWDRTPREEETNAILERCSKLDSRISQKSNIAGTAVGLRPGRKEIRLELEYLKEKDGDVNGEDAFEQEEEEGSSVSYPVIHNYGHGGGGLTVCYGCANEVVQLVKDHFFNNAATFVEMKS